VCYVSGRMVGRRIADRRYSQHGLSYRRGLIARTPLAPGARRGHRCETDAPSRRMKCPFFNSARRRFVPAIRTLAVVATAWAAGTTSAAPKLRDGHAIQCDGRKCIVGASRLIARGL
jgi:hypothetical protein